MENTAALCELPLWLEPLTEKELLPRKTFTLLDGEETREGRHMRSAHCTLLLMMSFISSQDMVNHPVNRLRPHGRNMRVKCTQLYLL